MLKNKDETALMVGNGSDPLDLMARNFNLNRDAFWKVLINTVIKSTKNSSPTDEEVMAFVIVAEQYGLNPLMKEIHAFASNGGITPIVGIDGWIKLVNKQPLFNGVRFEEKVDDDNNPICTTCFMSIKGRDESVSVTEWFDECVRDTQPWKMRRRMLRHKSYIQCARVAFGLSGLYDEDEARDIIDCDATPSRIAAVIPNGRSNIRQLKSPAKQDIGNGNKLDDAAPQPELAVEPVMDEQISDYEFGPSTKSTVDKNNVSDDDIDATLGYPK